MYNSPSNPNLYKNSRPIGPKRVLQYFEKSTRKIAVNWKNTLKEIPKARSLHHQVANDLNKLRQIEIKSLSTSAAKYLESNPGHGLEPHELKKLNLKQHTSHYSKENILKRKAVALEIAKRKEIEKLRSITYGRRNKSVYKTGLYQKQASQRVLAKKQLYVKYKAKNVIQSSTVKATLNAADIKGEKTLSALEKLVSDGKIKVAAELKSASNSFTKLVGKRPIVSKVVVGSAIALISFNFIKNKVNRLFSQDTSQRKSPYGLIEPIIPDYYNRGYDSIKENLTDFGSPVKSTVAQKTITPYKSSVRRAVKTTTNSVMRKNMALTMHSNAIQHNRY